MQKLAINKFYGGMSDSDAYTSEAMSSYQQNLDWMSQPEVLKLNRAMELEINTWLGVTVAQTNSYYWTDAGEVYNSSGVVVYALPAWKFYNAIKFWANFIGFYIQAGRLKLTQTPLSSSWTPNWLATAIDYGINPDLTQFQPDVQGHLYCPAVNDSEDVLYFIWKNVVYSVLISQLPLISPSLTLESNVVWVTRQWQQISIYLQSGRKYFWDWFSEQHDWYVDLWLMIRFVYTTRNYDYVVAWAAADIYSKFFMSQGQSFQLLRTWQFTLDDAYGSQEQRRHAYWLKTPYWNMSMVADEKSVFIPNSWMRAIESYGNKTPWLPQGTVIEILNDARQYIGGVWFEPATPDVLYASVQDANLNWSIIRIPFFRTPTPTYQASGLYYTKKYVMWVYRVRIKEVVVRKETPANTTLSIYVAVDGWKTYELLKTITWTDRNIKISSPNIVRQGYEFQYKIEMTTTNTSVTPLLYSMSVEYEQAEQ